MARKPITTPVTCRVNDNRRETADHRWRRGRLLYELSGSWSAGFYGSALIALVAAGLAFGLRASRSAKAVGIGSPVAAR